jgi:hypothetical protein
MGMLGTSLDSLQEYRLGYRERAVRVTKPLPFRVSYRPKQQIPAGNDSKKSNGKGESNADETLSS